MIEILISFLLFCALLLAAVAIAVCLFVLAIILNDAYHDSQEGVS